MLVAYVGGIGSGKSLSLVKELVSHKETTFTNFKLKLSSIKRIKKENIIATDESIGKRGKVTRKLRINWNFWNSQKFKFHLALDEVHNILHSRQSMSRWNTLMSMWIAQMRKILGDSEDKHLYIISQKIMRVDVALRDLLNKIIFCQCYYEIKNKGKKVLMPKNEFLDKYKDKLPVYCRKTKVLEKNKVKIKLLPKTYIVQYEFTGEDCYTNFQRFKLFREQTYDKKTSFVGNPYFKYYDSYEIINFGDDVYL